jgi:hypothetical protein
MASETALGVTETKSGGKTCEASAARRLREFSSRFVANRSLRKICATSRPLLSTCGAVWMVREEDKKGREGREMRGLHLQGSAQGRAAP